MAYVEKGKTEKQKKHEKQLSGTRVTPWAGSSKSFKSASQPKGPPLGRKLKITQIGLPAQGSPLGPEAENHSNWPSRLRVPPWAGSSKSLKSAFQPKGPPLDREPKINEISLQAQGSPLVSEAWKSMKWISWFKGLPLGWEPNINQIGLLVQVSSL